MDQRIPLRNPTFDVRKLAAGSAESLLFLHINGILSVDELGILTGLEENVETLIAALEAKGAIFTSQRGTERGSGRQTTPPPVSAVRDEGIDSEKARRIRAIFSSLTTLNHYEILGVSRSAEKGEIKKSYYHLVSEFHPDRLFGKRVGELRSQLEDIFRRVTEAYDILTDATARHEYDALLPPPPISASQSTVPPPARDAFSATLPPPARSPPSMPVAKISSASISIPPPPRAPLSSQSREVDDARKRLLAAKLGGGRFRSQPPSAPAEMQHPVQPSKQGSTKGT